MAVSPSRYERLPSYRDESGLTSSISNEIDDHRAVSPISPLWSEEVIRHSFDQIKTDDIPQTLGPRSRGLQTIRRKPVPSSTFDFSNGSQEIHANKHRHQKRPLRRSLARTDDWWWWELGSVLLSLACLVAIIIVLYNLQGKSLSSWQFSIKPNTLISIFATVSKASLMLSVAACISQLKWLYFNHGNHRLYDLQLFDSASRGPLGALDLITSIKPKTFLSAHSTGSLWAIWGAICIILALALDPFAQQIVSFPTRDIPSDKVSAGIQTAQIYDTGDLGGTTASWGMLDFPCVHTPKP